MTEPGPDDKVYPVFKLATIVKSLTAAGVPAKAALAGVGLSESALSSRATRVSLNQMIECCRNADRLAQDRWFAYRTGLRFHVSAYGIFGFAMLSSTDFRRTMQFIVKYRRLAAPLCEVLFKEVGGSGIWTGAPLPHPHIDAHLYRFLVELHFGILLSILRDIIDQTFAFRELHVTYDAPDDAAKFAEVFGCKFVFGQPENQVVFDAVWLDRTPNLGNEITYSMLVELCDELLEEFEYRLGVAGKIRQMVLIKLMRPARFDAVAVELKMSPRTLRRKLREESTSYRKLIDELRRNMALKYLRDRNLTVEQISSLVGFSEAANFRHAFRRWTKTAPARFRGISGRA